VLLFTSDSGVAEEVSRPASVSKTVGRGGYNLIFGAFGTSPKPAHVAGLRWHPTALISALTHLIRGRNGRGSRHLAARCFNPEEYSVVFRPAAVSRTPILAAGNGRPLTKSLSISPAEAQMKRTM
jgi:hypothetical protein